MKIKKFSFHSSEESLVKIVKETLLLFKIEILPQAEDAAADYDEIEVEHQVNTRDGACFVGVKLTFYQAGQAVASFAESRVRPEERQAAEIRRLVKLKLYELFMERLKAAPAPWGVLHGVRPTKIAHKYIERGFSRQQVADRLQEDFAVSLEKAEMMTDLAFLQRPFLSGQKKRSIAVYLGIPFCLSRCLYCSFPSYVLPEKAKLQEFLRILEKDIQAAKESIERHHLQVESIYIGGGTPTSLPEAAFDHFLQVVQAAFFTDETAEFTVEAGRPDSVSDAKINSMLRCHVGRVSVNPQTMQEKTLKHIGRKHTPEDIIDLFGKFRKAGLQKINMDTIIGLPGETARDVEDTMQKIAGLGPDNLTVHTLALKRGSQLKLDREGYCLPDGQMAREMFAITQKWARQLGMRPYYLYRQGYMSGDLENVGYSKPGDESLYNIKIMEEKQTIIGIGAAATTKIVHGDGRAMDTSFHPKDLLTYMQGIDKYIKRRTDLLDAAFEDRRNQGC